jgi:hypothetical protein
LLFHGQPGTGKTHCIRYLSGCLADHTTLLITAEQVGLLPEYMALARLLQPALVVIEDADLIARDRSELNNACDEVMLNRLLNELDGLRERADVFFILTTNRPTMLEPALVSRPGRIDQAIEFPLPSASLRRRLVTLYARGLPVSAELVDALAERTEGASPAFIKELLRRVAQHHIELGSPLKVANSTADSALPEECLTRDCWAARPLRRHPNKAPWTAHPTWRQIFGCLSPYLVQLPSSTTISGVIAEAFAGSGTLRKLNDQDFQTISVQLRALGLVNIQYLKNVAGGMGLYWSATPRGDRLMLELRTIKSATADGAKPE